MNDIADFERAYGEEIANAIAVAGMPDALLERYVFESCLRKDEGSGKEVYILSRRTDGVRAGLRVTRDASVDDALEEAGVMKKLEHPAVPRVLEAFEHEGRRFVVREYVEGRTLYEIIRTGGAMRARDIYGVVLKLCDVLSYLHSQSPPVIHRDIKPQNIIVAPDGGLHLIDFGIARLQKEGLSQDTSIALTHKYAPPEQYGYAQTSPLTDIYAMGVVALFMATGKEDRTELDERVKDGALRRLVEGCIAFDPGARFQNAQSVAAYIRRNSDRARRCRVLLTALLLVALAAASAASAYWIGRRSGETKGHMLGRESGYVAGYGEGYDTGYQEAPKIEYAETAYESAFGNAQGNLAVSNGGFAAQSEDEIFYIADGSIYRMAPETGEAELMLEVQDAYCLNYYEGWLYYVSNHVIQRVRPDTLEREVFCDAVNGMTYIIDGNFYVSNGFDKRHLYQIDPENGSAVKLNDLTQYYYINFSNGRIYFTYEPENRRLYSCYPDGSDMRCVHDRTSEWISIYNEKLYCFTLGNNGGCLTRMDLDGSNVELLVRDSADYINVTASGIFFACGNDKRLERLGFDGKTRHIIVPGRIGPFNVAGEWIFYVNLDDDALWRVRIDGSDNQRVPVSEG